jgi:UPF0716 family protein affecting phage T7 exclusion
MNRQVAVLLLAAFAAGPLLAREPGFGEFRAAQESVSLQALHPKVDGQNAD